MLDHLRHSLSSARYNLRGHLGPARASHLAGAWLRNEVGFLRRTSRLSEVLDANARELDRLLRESGEVMEYCRTELARYSLVLPGLLNPNYGPVLYATVRVARPDIVVETGVGSGVSSTFFLSAMEANGVGRLYSIDLPLPNERLVWFATISWWREWWLIRLRSSWWGFAETRSLGR